MRCNTSLLRVARKAPPRRQTCYHHLIKSMSTSSTLNKNSKMQMVSITKRRFEELLLAEATQLAGIRQTSVSIDMMIKFGMDPDSDTIVNSAKFLYRELPVRYAVRAKEFELAPSWIKTKSFKLISETYLQCFMDLRSIDEPDSTDDAIQLRRILTQHKDRLAKVIPLLSEGVHELKNKRGMSTREEQYLHDLLDRFLTARIGTSVLTSQHLELHQDLIEGKREGYVGALQVNCSPKRIFLDAAENVRLMCEKELGTTPGVELLKNSFRAQVEHSNQFQDDLNFQIPPVEVVIGSSKEDEDVVIMVRDRGGGIPSSKMPDVWKYTHSSAEGVKADDQYGYANHRRDGILAGMGFGLPLSRLYARFFGGDLEVCSLAGIGTAAYVRLKRLGGVEQAHMDKFSLNYPKTFTPAYPFPDQR
eukprot:jgi/Bigna1/65978/fgenesh1_pg.1_\